mmetsp:Transcript_8192/g.19761  ORF Transcript_8192/g.19761 Transcript_8192/m.19761 type:complete len:760 (+) Transcript_8192:79-2358(+)
MDIPWDESTESTSPFDERASFLWKIKQTIGSPLNETGIPAIIHTPSEARNKSLNETFATASSTTTRVDIEQAEKKPSLTDTSFEASVIEQQTAEDEAADTSSLDKSENQPLGDTLNTTFNTIDSKLGRSIDIVMGSRSSDEDYSHSNFTDEQSLDDIVEIPIGKNVRRPSRREKFQWWLRGHKYELIALSIFITGIIILIATLATHLGRESDDGPTPPLTEDAMVSAETTSPIFTPTTVPPTVTTAPFSSQGQSSTDSPVVPPTTPPTDGPTPRPTSATAQPVGPTVSPTMAPSLMPVLQSIRPQLVDAIGGDIERLLDLSNSPHQMAYEWMMNIDELRWTENYPTKVQRFLLAAFYFATGGGLVTTTWEVCSAVPSETLPPDEANAFDTRCISRGDEVVCAHLQAFEDCPEYYERFDLDPPSNPKKRWLSGTSECDWFGIECDNQGHVMQISLPKNNLVGSLIKELALLDQVGMINLSDNELGNFLPSWQGWNQLKYLSLSHNMFEGTIPTEWQQLTNLSTLDLANNQISGLILLPNNWVELDTLILNSNSGLSIELSEQVGTLRKLETLDLQGSLIISDLPASMMDLTNLKDLNLAHCGLLGTVPTSLGNMASLVELQLQGNKFTGELPDNLWRLTDLEVLRLEGNQVWGRLSSDIGDLVKLKDLRLSNTLLDGYIPDEISNLQALERAHFALSYFKGKVPTDLCALRDSTLRELSADCSGSKKMKCQCCTLCCDRKDDTCSMPAERSRKRALEDMV